MIYTTQVSFSHANTIWLWKENYHFGNNLKEKTKLEHYGTEEEEINAQGLKDLKELTRILRFKTDWL